MPKASPALNAFNAGEWSPLLDGRQDLSKYQIALKRMRNFFPKVQGPAVRRPGTRYVQTVKDSEKFVRLLPFEFSVEQAYIIEAGEGYFRFYRNNGRIEESGSAVELGGSPYLEEHLPNLRYMQSADVLYLFHPDVQPHKLSRTSHVDWSIDPLVPKDGPYLPTNTTSTTLNPSATSGSITLTASSTEGINSGTGFQETDVGRLVRLKSGANWGWAEITSYTSTTQVSADVQANFSGSSATAEWRLGLWSDTTGYPSVGVSQKVVEQ